MSESKHTEGPWEARGARVYDASGEEVAVATRASSRNRKHANANARLIAAAPDMLEALIKVADWLETEFEGQDESEIAQRDSGLEEARAAIAKATGE